MKQLFICLMLAMAVTACKEKTEDPAPVVVQEDPKEDVIEMETPYGKMYITP
jgi:hypothetical protein